MIQGWYCEEKLDASHSDRGDNFFYTLLEIFYLVYLHDYSIQNFAFKWSENNSL